MSETQHAALDGALNGHDLFGAQIRREATAPIQDRFLIAPFSVLSSRDGVWQERKRAWLSTGIKGECGRSGLQDTCFGKGAEYSGDGETIAGDSGSLFDPVLAEIAYRWFCPPDGQVIDPFCGGSVRGIVAGMMGRKYWGCDLRDEQVMANYQQSKEINPHVKPEWVQGDAMDALSQAPEADLAFSCPPYGDLEKYSDNPQDLSAMEWPAFVEAHAEIIRLACGRLKNNRFAGWVVGDFRDDKGHYRNFVGETVNAFLAAGLQLYNWGIFVTPCGTLPLRITKQFEAGRKFGKGHQDFLVFVKGDWRKATEALKPKPATAFESAPDVPEPIAEESQPEAPVDNRVAKEMTFL